MYESKDLNRPYSSSSTAQMSSSGLLRYRSAPSTLLAELSEDFLPIRPSSPETESMFARFLNPDTATKIPPRVSSGSGYPPPMPPPPPPPQATPTSDEMIYQQQQHMLTTSMAMEDTQLKNESTSNLIRHSSSPAGLFANLNFDNGYGVMRGMSGNSGNNGNSSGNSRLKSQLSYPSRQSSVMSQISEMENESMDSGYNHMNSWEQSSILSDNNYSGMKRPRDGQIEHQNVEVRNGLGHQFNLPKTTSEMAVIEKFLQFQDSVPCKIRAKRGCATHPRSIAERVRRTRISERMRKLQELVPNMDKQTNTADMLDLAVDYIKDLQKQVKGLTDSRANCTCSSSSKQKLYMNPQA